MRIQEIQHGLLLAALLLVSHAVLARGDTFLASSPRAAFVGRNVVWQQDSSPTTAVALSLRGGATRAVEEDSDEEEESEDEEEEESDVEEEEEDSFDASLAAAAVKSTQKAKTKAQSSKTSAIKKTMSAKLSTKPKAKKSSLLKFLRVPYILRACLNPFTVASMTKHFWVSLLKLDYPPKDVSQDLRSALDEKARKGGPSTQPRGRRKMKRGQAKTLSDLPKLNT